MFQSIVVALDCTPLSDTVLQAVHQLQLAPTDTVILTHVIPASDVDDQQPADQPSTDPTLGLFRHIEVELQGYQATLPCPSKLEIVTGDPAEEIIRLANIYQAQLIVLGNRGLTGMNRILQGSVSSQVVGEAPCSVMVVKPVT